MTEQEKPKGLPDFDFIKEKTEMTCAVCKEVSLKSTTCPKCGHYHEWGFDWKAVGYLQNK